jgi:rhomboid protease GluP
LLLPPGVDESQLKRFALGRKPKKDDLIEMLRFLVPRGEHIATSLLLDLNILVFLLMFFSGLNMLSPNGQELLKWGANRRDETLTGDWWRLFTSMFVHGGIIHLFLNIMGLLIGSFMLERILGWKRFLALYLLAGLCGSIASIAWYPHMISVGASGAIFGLFGAMLGLLLTDAFPKKGKKAILIFAGTYAGINLVWGLTGGIDNAAHIGGLLGGALLGILLYKLEDE